MYKLGIIGGMGSEATCDFFKRIVEYTKAKTDQDHINMCILNKASIPDRTSNILKNTKSPVKVINQCIEDLSLLKCQYFAIPCNTAHYYLDQLIIPKDIKFINMVEETLKYVHEEYKDYKLCVLGTRGTIKGKVYENYGNNLDIIYPKEDQLDRIMEIIYKTKEMGIEAETFRELESIIDNINHKYGKVVFIFACTELSLYTRLIKDIKFVDAMDILVQEVVLKCSHKSK